MKSLSSLFNSIVRKNIFPVILPTITPVCTPKASPNGILYTVRNLASFYSYYACHTYTWAVTRLSATLSFFFRHDAGCWMLDEVSVYHGATQMIANGGFETGDLTEWTYSGSCVWFTERCVLYNNNDAKSDCYFYYGTCRDGTDRMRQMFSKVVGDIYIISFWLIHKRCCGITAFVNITISCDKNDIYFL